MSEALAAGGSLRYTLAPMKRLLGLAAVSLSLTGCGDSGAGGSGRAPATAISLQPAQFLGNVPCLDAPGALRRYVATLIDVSDYREAGPPPGDFVIPSVGPVPCHQGVEFHQIEEGHQYEAEIEGYDREDIVALQVGSRIMVDAATGAVVAPRWTASCGRGFAGEERSDGGTAEAGMPPTGIGEGGTPDGGTVDASSPDAAGPVSMDAAPLVDAPAPMQSAMPADASTDAARFGYCSPTTVDGAPAGLDGPVCARALQTVPMRGCTPFRESAPSAVATGILVDVPSALVGLSCGDGVDQVAVYSVRIRGGEQLEQSVPCGEPVQFSDLEADAAYAFDVDAFGIEDAMPRWRTSCAAVTVEHVVVTAGCDPLRLVANDAGE